MEEIQDKEQYAKTLILKAELCIKIIKGLVIAAGALMGVLLIYSILALTLMSGNGSALIGFIVILSFTAAIFVTLIAMFAYAKINLNRLRKLG